MQNDELVKRLRAKHPPSGNYMMKPNGSLVNPDGPEAANTITALQAEVARLREALEPFAQKRTIGEILHQSEPDEWAQATPERRIEMLGERKAADTANILRARKALENRHD